MIHAVTELNPDDTNACAISDERWGLCWSEYMDKGLQAYNT